MPRVSLLLASPLVALAACSLTTDFDRFEADPCSGMVPETCQALRVVDGACVSEQLPADTPCGAGTCGGTAGVCSPAGVCVSEPTDLESNDRCNGASPLLRDTSPGMKTPAGPFQCLRDDATASCSQRGSLDAFFSLDLPVPRRLVLDVRRAGGGPLGRPAQIAFLSECGGEELVCAGDTVLPLPYEGTFAPRSFRVLVDVAARAGDVIPPEFEVVVAIDPQDACNPRTPVITAPTAPGADGVVSFDASTLGAADDFPRAPMNGVTPDHVYAIEITRPGRYAFDTSPVADEFLAPGELNLGDTVLTLLPSCDPSATPIATNDDFEGDFYANLIVDLQPGTYFLVVDGFASDDVGTYVLDVRLAGQLILIGHDYFTPIAGRTDLSPEILLGNAVAAARHADPIRVLEYTQFADVSATGELANARVAWLARLLTLGRTAVQTEADDYTEIEAGLANADVLLIYEQERFSGDATLIATFLDLLPQFLATGGVVVVSDHFGFGSSRLVNDPALLAWTSVTDASDDVVNVRTRTDPLARDLPATYTATNGSGEFVGVDLGVAQAVVVGVGNNPVVVRRDY